MRKRLLRVHSNLAKQKHEIHVFHRQRKESISDPFFASGPRTNGRLRLSDDDLNAPFSVAEL